MSHSGREQRLTEVKVETGETGERVSALAAAGLYFLRHSDFILATNKERPLCVSMVTPCSSNDGEDKGAGKKIHFGLRLNIFLRKFC